MQNYQSAQSYDYTVTSIVHVLERKPDPNWQKKNLCGNPTEFFFCITLSGEAIYQFYDPHNMDIPTKSLHIYPGDLLFIKDNQIRDCKSVPENPWHFINIRCQILAHNEQSYQSLKALPLITHHVPASISHAFMELNSVWTSCRPAYYLKCRSIIEGILYDLIQLNHMKQSDSKHYQKIEAVRAHIQNNLTTTFSVEELAQMADLSPSYFRTQFKNVVGMTASQYMIMMRIHKAKDLLVSGEVNVSEAASLVGYHDIYYFSRHFKSVTGFPPSHFIR